MGHFSALRTNSRIQGVSAVYRVTIQSNVILVEGGSNYLDSKLNDVIKGPKFTPSLIRNSRMKLNRADKGEVGHIKTKISTVTGFIITGLALSLYSRIVLRKKSDRYCSLEGAIYRNSMPESFPFIPSWDDMSCMVTYDVHFFDLRMKFLY